MHVFRFAIIETVFHCDWKNICQELHIEQNKGASVCQRPGYRPVPKVKAIRRIPKMHSVLSKRVEKVHDLG